MLTGKQRATLRAFATRLDAVQQIGHSGVTEEVIQTVLLALKAKELVKFSVLETAPLNAKETANVLATATGAEVIGVIGKKFVLYLQKEENSAFADLI